METISGELSLRKYTQTSITTDFVFPVDGTTRPATCLIFPRNVNETRHLDGFRARLMNSVLSSVTREQGKEVSKEEEKEGTQSCSWHSDELRNSDCGQGEELLPKG